ncbi:hypothetical protein BJ170DRAFT_627766 [Xylariales sp. AK1849]|nr:hypothetical protein BJ170DRAFT_627766 [Xylariales sp. AK1849]
MDQSELLALAHEYAGKSIDLYELLGIDAIRVKEEKEVRRAYRKQSIKYHPDKTGANFDETKWQLLERGRDVLLDVVAREAYGSLRSAALIRDQERQAMDAKRRAMIDDLEARERGDTPKRKRDEGKNTMSEVEIRRARESGRNKIAERQREMREAEERMRKAEGLRKEQGQPQQQQQMESIGQESDDDDPEIAAVKRRLREVQERKAAKKARKSGFKPPSAEAQKKIFTFSAPSTTTPPSVPSTKPRGKTDWASTMARLKAAQAEKERKKAEAAGTEAAVATKTTL